MTGRSILVICAALAVAGCGKQEPAPTAAPAAPAAAPVATAPAPAASTPTAGALTPAQEQAIREAAGKQAAQTINASNAKAEADRIASELEKGQ